MFAQPAVESTGVLEVRLEEDTMDSLGERPVDGEDGAEGYCGGENGCHAG